MVVARVMLVVLVLALLAPTAAPCLRCWPDSVPYVHYDVQLLLGGGQPGAGAGMEKELSALLLQGDSGVGFMERECLEREAGKLFYHLNQIITRNRQDPGQLMKEAALEKQNFTRRLRAASAAVLQQVCSTSCGRPQPFDLAKCDSCQRLQAWCKDQRVCAGSTANVAVGLVLGGLALGAAVGRRTRTAGSPEPQEEPEAGGTEPSTEQGEEGSTEQEPGAPMAQDRAPTEQGDGVPTKQGEGAQPQPQPQPQPQQSEGGRFGNQ